MGETQSENRRCPRSNWRIAVTAAGWDNADRASRRLGRQKRRPNAEVTRGLFVVTGPLVTSSPRPFSDSTEPSGQSSPEKDLGHPRTLYVVLS